MYLVTRDRGMEIIRGLVVFSHRYQRMLMFFFNGQSTKPGRSLILGGRDGKGLNLILMESYSCL